MNTTRENCVPWDRSFSWSFYKHSEASFLLCNCILHTCQLVQFPRKHQILVFASKPTHASTCLASKAPNQHKLKEEKAQSLHWALYLLTALVDRASKLCDCWINTTLLWLLQLLNLASTGYSSRRVWKEAMFFVVADVWVRSNGFLSVAVVGELLTD